jgi:hypothetical protein
MQVSTNLGREHRKSKRFMTNQESAMFFQTIRSNLTARRIALVAAPLAVFGAAVTTASAADHGWWGRSRGPTVVINTRIPAPRVIERRVERVDEVPAALQMNAYQSKDRIVVIISGTNRGAGFSTSLSQSGYRDGAPMLQLCNMAPADGCRDGAVSFTMTAGVHSDRELRSLCLRIGDRTFEIPVTCVPNLG